jgi:hypothetical protein
MELDNLKGLFPWEIGVKGEMIFGMPVLGSIDVKRTRGGLRGGDCRQGFIKKRSASFRIEFNGYEG